MLKTRTAKSRSPKYHRKLGFSWIKARFISFWGKSLWSKIITVFLLLLAVWIAGMYAIAQWYIYTERNKPLVVGTSFIPAYAESLGLDPKQTMDALINDLGIKHFRLVSYWDQLEPSQGHYDFSLLDWQFKKAEAAHATVTLSVGLRQPRWPECHTPSWAANESVDVWEPQLLNFMTAVVNRYKHSPSLDSYQVENEYFLSTFGNCTNFDHDRLVDEYNLVKQLDPYHTAIISRSNNALGWPTREPIPDEFGVSLYKRVWDATITHRYIEYPFPAWYYASMAGWEKMLTGRDLMIHELQTEPWTPRGLPLVDTSIAEQNKSFDAARFEARMRYARGTGMREMYLWGSEVWYYRLTKLHDPSLWNVAKKKFQDANTEGYIE